MKKIYSILILALVAIVANAQVAITPPSLGDHSRKAKLSELPNIARVNGPRLAPQKAAANTLNVDASQFSAGVGLIKFNLVTYANYANLFDFAVLIAKDNAGLGYDWFYAEDGEDGVLTASILGEYLAPGDYTAIVYGYYGDDVYEQGSTTFTITDAASDELIQISDLKAENSDDLSTTTISWTETGTLPTGGYTLVEISSTGNLVYSSTIDYGKVAISSPITVSLEKDKDYFIYVYEYPTATAAASQYLTASAIQHSVGTNPYTPVDLDAQVNGSEVTFTWKSYDAASVPAYTRLWILNSDGSQIVATKDLTHADGGGTDDQTYTVTNLDDGTYWWAVRPADASGYWITSIVYSDDPFTIGASGIESLKTTAPTAWKKIKVLENGKVIILDGEKKFNLAGAELK